MTVDNVCLRGVRACRTRKLKSPCSHPRGSTAETGMARAVSCLRLGSPEPVLPGLCRLGFSMCTHCVCGLPRQLPATLEYLTGHGTLHLGRLNNGSEFHTVYACTRVIPSARVLTHRCLLLHCSQTTTQSEYSSFN